MFCTLSYICQEVWIWQLIEGLNIAFNIYLGLLNTKQHFYNKKPRTESTTSEAKSSQEGKLFDDEGRLKIDKKN